jgi:hypothetical protein
LTGDYLRTIPAYFGLNWLSGFKGRDFKVIFDKISLISIFRQMHSYLSLTWNNYSNISADSVGKCGFNGVKIISDSSKMATITKNRYFFKRPKLLHFKLEWTES